jgi:hypothetical protein
MLPRQALYLWLIKFPVRRVPARKDPPSPATFDDVKEFAWLSR